MREIETIEATVFGNRCGDSNSRCAGLVRAEARGSWPGRESGDATCDSARPDDSSYGDTRLPASAMLGQSTVSLALDLYSHVRPSMRSNVASKEG